MLRIDGDGHVCSSVQKVIEEKLRQLQGFTDHQVTVNLRSSWPHGMIVVALTRKHDLSLAEEQIKLFRALIVSDEVKAPIQVMLHQRLSWSSTRFQACGQQHPRRKSYMWQILSREPGEAIARAG